MKKLGKTTSAALALVLALVCLGAMTAMTAMTFLLRASADEGDAPVTAPINITFDTSKWFVSTRISGATASKMAAFADITHYRETDSADGWYVDSAPEYTCIVERDPDVTDPASWPKLNDSDELLKADGDYYYRFEIEDADGFDWEKDNVPAVTVNGKAPDFSTAHKAEGGGYFDVFVKAVFDEVSEQVAEISFRFFDTAIQRGTSRQLDYTVYGTSADVTWTHDGVSAGTSITPEGLVTIGPGENAYVNITATSAINPLVTASCRVIARDDPIVIEQIKVTPLDVEVAYPGLYVYFKAEVTGTDMDYIEWSLSSETTFEGTSINSSGELKIDRAETAESLTVRATSLVQPDKYGEYTLPIDSIRKIQGPIEITFNIDALQLGLGTTGQEVTGRLALAETAFTQFGSDNAKNGWYVDDGTMYTTLVERDFGTGNPRDWKTLGDDTGNLAAGKVYYLRIEIEDKRSQGYEWDVQNPPVFTVNGVEPDFVMPASGEEGYADVFVRLDVPGVKNGTLTDLKIVGTPKTEYTDGDYIRTVTYELRAVYDDGTELDLTGLNYLVASSIKDNSRLTPDVTEIVFTYRDGGVTKTATIPLKVTGYFDVTIDPLNGESPTVKEVKEGETLPDYELYTPNKTSLTFYGWYVKNASGEEIPFDAGAPVTGDIYVYAKYKALAEAHVHGSKGGTVKSVGALEDQEGDNVYAYWLSGDSTEGRFVAVPAEGYKFMGWRVNGSTGDLVVTQAENPDKPYYTKTANGDLYFTTSTGGYRFYAMFAEAEVVPESITIEKYPVKVVYNEGELFDPAGIEVSALFSNGTAKDVTSEVTFEPSGALSPSDKSVTVSYTDAGVTKTATLEISVKAAPETAAPVESETPGETENPTGEPEPTAKPEDGGKAVEIVTGKLDDAVKGKNYSAVIEVRGEGPVTLSIVGVLPDGIKFNASNGELYGTPSKAGTYSFVVKAENASGSVEKALTLNVVKKSAAGKVLGVIGIVLGSAAVICVGAAVAVYVYKRKHGA